MDAWGQRELPRRAACAVSRELDGEFIVLNTETDEAHHLNGDAAAVWEALETRQHLDFPLEQLSRILAHLGERGLLASGDRSRRSLLRAGTVASASVAVAGIQTLILPQAAWAGSNDLTFTAIDSGSFTFHIGHYVNSVIVTLYGGSGGGGLSTSSAAGGSGGTGGAIVVRLTLPSGRTASTEFTGVIGASGKAGGTSAISAGGYRVGGANANGGGGGGSSALYLPGTSTPLIAAGGGGGGGSAGTKKNDDGGRGGDGGVLNGTVAPNSGGAGNGPNASGGAAGTNIDSVGAPSPLGTVAGGAGGAGGGAAGSVAANGRAGGGGGGASAIGTTGTYSITAVTVATLAPPPGGLSGQPGSSGSISVVFDS